MCFKIYKLIQNFNMRNRLKFLWLTDQLIAMEEINFKRDLIENFIS